VIELDGGQHAARKGYDEWRSRLLAERGYRVIRFWDNQALTETDQVLEAIFLALQHQ